MALSQYHSLRFTWKAVNTARSEGGRGLSAIRDPLTDIVPPPWVKTF
ncbi:MAG: hypothetical protein OJF52_001415 [Nitrospira sp.]|nr:MAG: hypothetical protein OJF52_001415 [Nitrospira sp.]